MTTQDTKDLAVAREMLDAKDAEIAKLARLLAERDSLCESQTRTLTAQAAKAADLESRLAKALEGAYQMEGEANALDARLGHVLMLKDDAERKVCEMRERAAAKISEAYDRGIDHGMDPLGRFAVGVNDLRDATLADTADIASRWVRRCESVRSIHSDPPRNEQCAGAKGHRSACFGGVPPEGLDVVVRERDAAIAAKEAAERERDDAVAEAWRLNGVDGLKADAESREHALGVQVEALRERLALAVAVVNALKSEARKDDRLRFLFMDELFAYDAVPGDALAVPVVDYREASGVDVERVSVAVDEKGTEND